MMALDSNVLLRLLTRDDPVQLAQAMRFIGSAGNEPLLVPDLVLAEVVWTLLRIYRWPPPKVAAAVESLLGNNDIEFEDRDRVAAAVGAFAAGDDFADQLIVDIARAHGCTGIVTFDAGLAARHPGFAVRPE